MMNLAFIFYSLVLVCAVIGQHNPQFSPNRTGIVHLFEWKFADVARECEEFLAPKGFGGVQVSPVNENIIVEGRPWWERYQPLSYNIVTRSGDEVTFVDMTRRCNAVGVRIYVDVVMNHMSADSLTPPVGTGGSSADPSRRDYPAVPYSVLDFHPVCAISNYNDPYQVRNCELVGLHDLNQTVPWVREKLVQFLNHLVDLGVAGFRVDAAKHMWPSDLAVIYASIKNLSTDFGFAENSRPFIYQEIIDLGGEGVSKFEYKNIGVATEFAFANELGKAFRGETQLTFLSNFGAPWGFLNSSDALVFIDNHDNQRSSGSPILTYKSPRLYKMATAFAAAFPYGHWRMMSSFGFSDTHKGPPATPDGEIISPTINDDNTCNGGWICEHRWRQIYNMVAFKNRAAGTNLELWQSNGRSQIGFCRGDVGFVAFNNEDYGMRQKMQTRLAPGNYCDIISSTKNGSECSGKVVTVDEQGIADVEILPTDEDGVVAIYVDSKI